MSKTKYGVERAISLLVQLVDDSLDESHDLFVFRGWLERDYHDPLYQWLE